MNFCNALQIGWSPCVTFQQYNFLPWMLFSHSCLLAVFTWFYLLADSQIIFIDWCTAVTDGLRHFTGVLKRFKLNLTCTKIQSNVLEKVWFSGEWYDGLWLQGGNTLGMEDSHYGMEVAWFSLYILHLIHTSCLIFISYISSDSHIIHHISHLIYAYHDFIFIPYSHLMILIIILILIITLKVMSVEEHVSL